MSSQGANTARLSTGYAYNSSSVRDSSDITRQIRERVQYNQLKSGTTITGVTRDVWIPYGNQFRLSYLYGKYKCSACTGNTFGLNGVRS
jgi:hypothetical protein